MNVKHLVLFASLFALGCGEKSDEERLDDLETACGDLSRMAAEFLGPQRVEA